MFLSNILSETKALIESVGILKDYKVQITPDDRPFASSGDNTITIYGSDVFRIGVKQAAEYRTRINISVNRRTGKYPRDRAKELLYLEEINSLSTVSSIILSLIDSSNILYSNIVSSISSSKSSIIDSIENPTPIRSLTDAENALISSLQNAQVLGPILALGYTATPIPRFDAFFSAFNTKKTVEQEFESDRIQESGWSMVSSFQGPQINLPPAC